MSSDGPRDLEAQLRDYGLRATPQRVVVLEGLVATSHPDAETIYAFAQARHPSLSLATVYNVLEKLTQAGLVRTLEFHGRRCYDLRIESHDHVRCRNCGKLADVERDPATRLIQPPSAAWLIQDESLVWEGLCPDCRGGMAHA